MENQSLLLTMGLGVLASFALFFLFFKGMRWSGKLSALMSVLIVQLVYIPLAATHWAGLDVFAIHFAFFTMTAVILGIIVSGREGEDGVPTKGGGFHWSHGVMLGFFMILVVVDSTFITLANSGASVDFMRKFLPDPHREGINNVSSSFPGTVSNDFQKKYDQYNNYLSQLKAQTERGWQVKEGWQEKPTLNKPTLFRIHVLDKADQAVMGGTVQLSFLRPSNKHLDQVTVLTESAPGYYGASVSLPAPGAWNMVILVTRGEEVHEVKGETWVEAAQ
jgi:nitrogen fixation protein FixH